MKIIAKCKDYYDYLQGVYGMDDKLILAREKEFSSKDIIVIGDEFIPINIIVGKMTIDVIIDKSGAYSGEAILKHFDCDVYNAIECLMKNSNVRDKWRYRSSRIQLFPYHDLKNEKLTIKHDCPILMIRHGNVTKFPILKSFGVSSVLSAHDAWLLITEWLGQRVTRNEPEVPIGDNDTRILSAGFDLKTSFRGKNDKH